MYIRVPLLVPVAALRRLSTSLPAFPSMEGALESHAEAAIDWLNITAADELEYALASGLGEAVDAEELLKLIAMDKS